MEIEKRITQNVVKLGWHIINVFEESDSLPFSYTIGLNRSFNSPELFISGLKGEVSARIISNIALEVKAGLKLESGKEYHDFFEGYGSFFQLVHKSYYDKFFGQAVWFYQGYEFKVLQCVWPNKHGEFPWQTDMKFTQDVLFAPPR